MSTDFDSTLASLGIGRTNSASTASAATSSLGKSTLDQADFLKLMTAQLQNQDPFDPVDNNEMVAQMAQFSQLQGITDINTTLTAISDRLSGTSNADLMSWVGRTVQVSGDVAYPRTDGTLGASIALAKDAADVTVSISNASGETLKTVSLGNQKAGQIDFEWDGSTQSGEAAGDGPFTIKVSARGADGGSVAASTLVWAPVTAVAMGSDGHPELTLPGLGQVSATQVTKIG
ncbi:flagellar hook assembly protein FlgD [Sphingomonas sp. RS6]